VCEGGGEESEGSEDAIIITITYCQKNCGDSVSKISLTAKIKLFFFFASRSQTIAHMHLAQ
jgi:hypothetical protein